MNSSSSDQRGSSRAVFDDFVAAATNTVSSPTRPLEVKRVTVLGGGGDAQLLASLCLSEGAEVQLFSAYATELESLAAGIALNGAGPVGRYHVQSSSTAQKNSTAIRATGSLDSCVKDAELIFLTGPVHKQRTYAMVLADHLQNGQILVLPNARTFAALEASWLLKVGGCQADVTIVELQGLPYWHSNPNDNPVALTLEPVPAPLASCVPSKRSAATLNALANLIGELHPVNNVLQSSFSDCSALIDIPAILIAGIALTPGGNPIPAGGVPLAENQSFRNLIGCEQLELIEQLLTERGQVASRYGIRHIGSLEENLARYAGTPNNEGRRPIPNQQQAKTLIRDGAIASLVPLVDAGKVAGVKTPLTKSIITLCSSVLGSDLSLTGRHLNDLGVKKTQADSVFSNLSELARGAG